MGSLQRVKVFLSLFLLLSASWAHASEAEIRIGVSAPKSGYLARGASITHFPNIRLWAQHTNERGGIRVGDKKLPVRLIEYDDRSDNKQAVKNVLRLEKKDRAHFILAPYSTGINLSVAPTLARYGHPQLISTSITDRAEQLSKMWPNTFWLPGRSTQLVDGLVKLLSQLRETKKINNQVAMIAVSNPFGLELIKIARRALAAAEFEIVQDEVYPKNQKDYTALLKQAKQSGADSFLAFSYTPDTFIITEQAIDVQMNSKVMYLGVNSYLPAYQQQFGQQIEGIIGIGGVNSETEDMRHYIESYRAANDDQLPDYWSSALVYSGLQVLAQAIERSGTLERKTVVSTIAQDTFNTITGPLRFVNNVTPDYWTVGQWQDGVFHGIHATGSRDTSRLFQARTAW